MQEATEDFPSVIYINDEGVQEQKDGTDNNNDSKNVSHDSSESQQESGTSAIYSKELSTIKSLVPPAREDIELRKVMLGDKKKKYTLVLDLDQTLIFSTEQKGDGDGSAPKGYSVKIRPYASELLEKMSKKYEIVVFTAAEENYAKAIINSLDKKGEYVAKLLTREHCIRTGEGYYIKDLRILADRSTDEVLIVDDTIFSFAFQLENGIPVSPFTGDADDDELLFLMEYLEELYDTGEIVKSNKVRMWPTL